MHVPNYQQHSILGNAYFAQQAGDYFMHDPCIMCHHSSRHRSVLSTIANALFNYYLFPQAYVYVVSAPILTTNNTTVINPETSNRQDTNKAHANAKKQLVHVNRLTNQLKDLIEKINNDLFQFEKSPAIHAEANKLAEQAQYLITQEPAHHDYDGVQDFNTIVDVLSNKLSQLITQKKEFEINLVKSRKEALTSIENSKIALRTSFDELEKEYDLHGELKPIFISRSEFWTGREKLVASTIDFKDFNLETEKQLAVDFFLLSFLEDETTQAKAKNLPIPSHLGILSAVTDENFADKMASASKKFDIAPFSGMQISEIKNSIVDIMISVEKEQIAGFLDSLKMHQEEFATNGYMTVAEHYGETIAQFEEIAKKLKLESVDGYIDEWNVLLTEFDAEHQHLLKLLGAEKSLQNFSEQTLERLSNNIHEDRFYNVLTKLNDLSAFRYTKNELKDAADIDAYINKTHAFMTTVKNELLQLFA